MMISEGDPISKAAYTVGHDSAPAFHTRMRPPVWRISGKVYQADLW